VNGLLSIKGDLAKTMIFASGKLRKDSWQETVTGTIEEENMVVTITATRDDNGLTLTRSFSVDKAKRMGLWITSAQINSADGWKWKKSSWYKTPDRMVMYRCLGFIARDLFSDVLLNMYTTEEAQDIGKETAEVIETESGAKITIPDKEHAKQRSGKMTDRVADKIPDNKFGEVKKDNIQEAEVVRPNINQAPEGKVLLNETEKKNETSFIPDRQSIEYMNGVKVIRNPDTNEITNMAEIEAAGAEGNETPPETGKYTLKQLEDTDTKVLLQMINDNMDMREACEMIGGKNTNKKLREIIFAHQNGKLAEHVAKNMPKDEKPTEQQNATDEVSQPGEIKINKEFDKQGIKVNNDLLEKESKPIHQVEAGNKYGLVIENVSANGNRDFAATKQLFNTLAGVTPGINTNRYLELALKLGFAERFRDKEVFCRAATIEEINLLLNSN
jgi:hypothetical protein